MLSASAPTPKQPLIERDPADLGTGYTRYTTRDKLGRRITFYLSQQRPGSPRLPLAVFVSGSGCVSNFTKRGERVYGGLQNLLQQSLKGRARVMVVEKPGVRYLDMPAQPGSAEGCSQEFLEEHTLPRWAEAVGAAVRAAATLPDVDPNRILVAGHSEGGIVAARVAAENPRITHVASLSGGGPTQLFDLVQLARTHGVGDPTKTPDARAQDVYAAWADIQADPGSTKKRFWGHPYRRWSSFLVDSVLEELSRAKARVYIAQGSGDTSVAPESFDVMYAQLLTRRRDVTAEWIPAGDHGYRKADDKDPISGFRSVLNHVAAWYLDGDPPHTKPSEPPAVKL